tara:strand:+ start:287 stop:1024 length:738 start_codon:yes stop_codon:yes gene_type:complete
MKKKFLVIIPVRLKSKRLPNKPLLDFQGIPMIMATAINCSKVINRKNIIIATDSEKIKSLCIKYGFNYMITSKNCLTGTDRVVEVANKIKREIYINLQGDEPVFPKSDIKKFVNLAISKNKLICNGYCFIRDKKSYFSKNVPKVIFNKKNELLYMSRSPVPGNKYGLFKKAYRQVCIYSFPRNKLILLKRNKKKTPFEEIEDIEILRFLELGEKVHMIKLSSDSISVDTLPDYIKAQKVYKKMNK